MFDFLFAKYETTMIATIIGLFIALFIFMGLKVIAKNLFCKSKSKRLWDTPARPITPTPSSETISDQAWVAGTTQKRKNKI